MGKLKRKKTVWLTIDSDKFGRKNGFDWVHDEIWMEKRVRALCCLVNAIERLTTKKEDDEEENK